MYESWSLPFSVLLGTPIAVFGAFAALWSRQMVNNVFAQIGLVMLIGLAAKNAILIVEFARLEYEKGKPLIEAALTGARTRLRPILMTSFAFILGTVPLWIATGAGAVSRRIIGTVVIGGMLAATCIAVCLIPVTFYVVERFARSRDSEAKADAQRRRPARRGARRKARYETASDRNALWMRLRRLAAAAWSRACSRVAPSAQTTSDRPSIRPPPFAATTRPQTAPFTELAWWQVYEDATLQALIREAFTNNYDLRIAVTRVEQARAVAMQARSQFVPSANYNGTVSRGRNDLFGSAFPEQRQPRSAPPRPRSMPSGKWTSGAASGGSTNPRARSFWPPRKRAAAFA